MTEDQKPVKVSKLATASFMLLTVGLFLFIVSIPICKFGFRNADGNDMEIFSFILMFTLTLIFPLSVILGIIAWLVIRFSKRSFPEKTGQSGLSLVEVYFF